MMFKSAFLTLVATLGLLALAAQAGEVTLPVTKVTSFSSGVAYYQHDGKVSGDAEVLLKFKTDQINDILKSLVPLDLGGGTVTGVSYASQEPLAHALKSFGVDISGNPTLGELLNQIRGAEVALSAPAKVSGKILGVETKQKHILPDNTIINEEYLNVMTAEGLKSVPLARLESITLVNAKLNEELGKALTLLVESRDSNRKPVTIGFAGKGERNVSISYVNEAPIWKTSFRIVMGEADAKDKKSAMSLQGWAIVENTGDSDWDKVDLTLVSGRPISFVQDLYTPLFINRPVVQPELYSSLRPQRYEEGMEQTGKDLAELEQRPRDMKRAEGKPAGAAMAGAPPAAMAMEKADRSGRFSGLAKGQSGGIGGGAGAPAKDENDALAEGLGRALQQGVQAAATGSSVGELYKYHIDTPVTIGRRKSAMLPIINTKDLNARKVSIYNPAVMPKNPLNGLWLTNNTGQSLLAGPVTVFDAGTYAGDASLDNVSPNDKRLLSYAIDLKMTIDPSATNTSSISTARIVRGVLNITRRDEFTQTYVIKNKADQKRTLVIEHPRNQQNKLVKPDEPAEKTPALYRFEVEVPAAAETKPAEAKFVVVEEHVYPQIFAILPTDVGTLGVYINTKEIPQKVRDALAEAAKKKNEQTLAERALADIQRQINDLRAERAQLPPVMQALDRNSQVYKNYEKKLLDLEGQLDKLNKDLADQRTKVNDLRKAMEDYLNGMNVE